MALLTDDPMQTITATELARNTRSILDVVASRGETVSVERNHVVIARIAPARPLMTASQALANFRPLLSPAQGDAWLQTGRIASDDAVRDPWA